MKLRVTPAAGRRLGTVGLLLALQAVLVAAFVLPAPKPEPHHVPVGVVGQSALDGQQSASWDVKHYASESSARSAIEHREVYGAVLADGQVLVASAASATVASMLRQAVAERAPTDQGRESVEALAVSRGCTIRRHRAPLRRVRLKVAHVGTIGVRRWRTGRGDRRPAGKRQVPPIRPGARFSPPGRSCSRP